LRSSEPVGTKITRYDPLGAAGRYTLTLVAGSVLLFLVTIYVAWEKGDWHGDNLWLILTMLGYAFLILVLVVIVLYWLSHDLRNNLEKWQTYYELPAVVPDQAARPLSTGRDRLRRLLHKIPGLHPTRMRR
jgi:hypothetical protein